MQNLHFSENRACSNECRVCGHPAPVVDVVDLGKSALPAPYVHGLHGRPVYYSRCKLCGYLFTADMDDWSQETFKKEIYNDDYVLFDPDYVEKRPREIAIHFAGRLRNCPRDIQILDYGAGSARFSAHMNDHGFTSVDNFDPFSNAVPLIDKFDIIIATEVVEHVPDPLKLFADMKSRLKPGGLILFTTCLQPADIMRQRGNWWYVAPRNGHVSLHTRSSLELCAAKLGFEFLSDEFSVHAFVKVGASPYPGVTDGLTQQCFSVVLSSPSDSAQDSMALSQDASEWHGLENMGEHIFRWSAKTCLHWTLKDIPRYLRRIRFIIPVLSSFRPSSDTLAVAAINERRLPISATDTWYGRELSFKVDRQACEGFVAIETVPIISPAALAGGQGDARQLGFAVAAGNSDAAAPH